MPPPGACSGSSTTAPSTAANARSTASKATRESHPCPPARPRQLAQPRSPSKSNGSSPATTPTTCSNASTPPTTPPRSPRDRTCERNHLRTQAPVKTRRRYAMIAAMVRVLRWSLALAVLLLIGACGSTRQQTQPSAAPVPPVTTTVSARTATSPTTTTPAATSSLGTPVVHAALKLRSADGYSATIVIRVYQSSRGSTIPTLPFSRRTTLAACQVDPQADAVVPVSFVATNTTEGYSEPITVLFNAPTDSPGRPLNIEVDTAYSDGTANCGNGQPYGTFMSMRWVTPVAPHQSVNGDFYVIVKDYYSPATPNGDSNASFDCLLPALTMGAPTNTINLDFVPSRPVAMQIIPLSGGCQTGV